MPLRRLRATLLISLFLTVAIAHGGQSKDDQSKTVLKTNTRLVVVDVVATDTRGVPTVSANCTRSQ